MPRRTGARATSAPRVASDVPARKYAYVTPLDDFCPVIACGTTIPMSMASPTMSGASHSGLRVGGSAARAPRTSPRSLMVERHASKMIRLHKTAVTAPVVEGSSNVGGGNHEIPTAGVGASVLTRAAARPIPAAAPTVQHQNASTPQARARRRRETPIKCSAARSLRRDSAESRAVDRTSISTGRPRSAARIAMSGPRGTVGRLLADALEPHPAEAIGRMSLSDAPL